MTTLEPLSAPGMSYLAEGDTEWETQTPASRRKVPRLGPAAGALGRLDAGHSGGLRTTGP
jgi:hypothetical protein